MFFKVFLRPSAGLLLNSIGVSLLPVLLPVDPQLAQYIAGLGQQILVALIVFAPMFDIHRSRSRPTRAFVVADTSAKRRELLSGSHSGAGFLHRP